MKSFFEYLHSFPLSHSFPVSPSIISGSGTSGATSTLPTLDVVTIPLVGPFCLVGVKNRGATNVFAQAPFMLPFQVALRNFDSAIALLGDEHIDITIDESVAAPATENKWHFIGCVRIRSMPGATKFATTGFGRKYDTYLSLVCLPLDQPNDSEARSIVGNDFVKIYQPYLNGTIELVPGCETNEKLRFTKMKNLRYVGDYVPPTHAKAPLPAPLGVFLDIKDALFALFQATSILADDTGRPLSLEEIQSNEDIFLLLFGAPEIQKNRQDSIADAYKDFLERVHSAPF